LAVRGVQLGSDLVLDQRLIELAGRSKPAAAVEVVLRRSQLGALERGTRVSIVGIEANSLGVLDHREVVVLTMFGGVAAMQRRRGGAAAGEQAECQKRGRSAKASLSDGMER